MNGEKVFGKLAETRPMNVPLGKGALFALSLIPGKLVNKFARVIMTDYIGPKMGGLTTDTMLRVSGAIDIALATLLSYGFSTDTVKGVLGETGSEALATGTIAGALDQLYADLAVKGRDADFSDAVTDTVVDKVVGAVAGPAGVGAPAEEELGGGYSFGKEATPGEAELEEELGALPERESAAWGPEEEEEYAGPEEGDPVENVEKVLAKKSEL